ncbi:MAG: hypothetical protein ISR65_02925 [Bacteriovoracaceae bacterium]|nr:hypothetical protein [Bacteriovoracaceae bacterium]
MSEHNLLKRLNLLKRALSKTEKNQNPKVMHILNKLKLKIITLKPMTQNVD